MSSSQLSRNPPSRRHKWALNFTKSRSDADRLQLVKTSGTLSTGGAASVATTQGELASPPGYIASSGSAGGQLHAEAAREKDPNLIVKRSWDIALAPLKQIPMNLFIMYMAGNSISIFPIMMIGMLFLKPVRALFTIGSTFKMIEGDQHLFQKFIYFIGNLAGLGVALYKCQSMGLLPTHPSDWLDFIGPAQRVEYSGGGILL